MNEKWRGKQQKGRNFNGAKQDLRHLYVPLPAFKAVLFFFSVSPCIRGRKEPAFWKNYCCHYYPLPTVWPCGILAASVDDDQFALFQGYRTRSEAPEQGLSTSSSLAGTEDLQLFPKTHLA
jgi:hypothetical protein